MAGIEVIAAGNFPWLDMIVVQRGGIDGKYCKALISMRYVYMRLTYRRSDGVGTSLGNQQKSRLAKIAWR